MHAVYLAAYYSRHPEMRRVRDELMARGYVVTSRWIDQHDDALPDSLDHVALNSNPERGAVRSGQHGRSGRGRHRGLFHQCRVRG